MMTISVDRLRELPRLNDNSSANPTVYLRWYCPDSACRWFATEGQLNNGEYQFFGIKLGPFESHWGYFTLEDLRGVRSPLGEPVRLDETWIPQPVSQIDELRDYVTQRPEKGSAPMGMTTALNAVIAYLEDRPALFKEMLRAPSSDVLSLAEVEMRLRQALNRYAATQIRAGLMESLHVAPVADWPGEAQQYFYDGVRATEFTFERLAERLEGDERR